MPDVSQCPAVVVAHDQQLFREGLAALLEASGFEVTGQAGDTRSIVPLIAQRPAQLLLVDGGLPGIDVEFVTALTKAVPHTAVVLIARPETFESSLATMHAGASGCISANLSRDEFVEALRLLAKGDVVVSREMASGLKGELSGTSLDEVKDDLSEREREVLGLVARGATNREIAQTLFVTENTVKVHLRHILDKLNLRNRQQAVAYAVREGMTTDEDADDE